MQRLELRGIERFVHLAPVDVLLARGFLHHELVVRRAASVLARAAHERAVLRLERLELAVNAFVEALHQQALGIAREQRIPVAAPDHLDDVPAGAAKIGFEFLNDFAVAAHRTVEPLQVAVDDENQVVELFAACQCNRAQRLGLIHFAVAHECPHLAAL